MNISIEEKRSTQSITGYIMLSFLAICFLATGGIFVKLSSLPPISTGFYRVFFSIPILFPFIKNDIKQIRKREFILLLLSGVFLALDLITWNISFHMTTVANANLLANMVPFTVIPLSYFLYKQKFKFKFYFSFFICLIGVYVLMSGKIKPSLINYRGDFLALTTSIFYGLFLLTVSNLRNFFKAETVMFVSGLGSAVVLFIFMIFNEGLIFPKTLHELFPIIGLTLLSQIFGQGLLSYCIGKINVSLSSVLVLTQPVVAALYSFFIFGELLSKKEILGIIIVLFGIFNAKKSFD